MARQGSKETTPDLFEEFGIAQDAEDVAITSDKIAEAFLETVGMDGGEPEPDDPNFWEKHDKKHHHGNFDPETQRCSLREEVEQDEKAKDKDDDIGSEQPNVAGLEAPEKRGAEEEKDTDWEKLDAEYMDAVKRGDMEKCTEMVRQAAAKAMPNTKVIADDGLPLVMYHFGRLGIDHYLNYDDDNDPFIAKVPIHFGTRKSAAEREQATTGGYDADEENAYGTTAYFLNIENPFEAQDGWGKTRDPKIGSDMVHEGFDGNRYVNAVEGKGDVSWVAYSPSQIKSADPVTYDDQGNVIPLSKRFQADNPDIRFSKEGGATSAWDATTRAEAEAAKEILEKCLYGTTVDFAEHEYQGDGEEESRASVVSPELDAEYMDAVERGDLEKCAKLVQEAAAKAGYTQEAWHYGDLALENSSDYNIPSGETHYGTREAALDRLRNRADSGAHEWAGYKLFEKDGKWFWQFKSEFYNTEEEAMKDMTSGGPFATKELAEDDMAKDYGGKLTKVYLNVDGARTVDEDDPKLQKGEDIVRYRNAQEDPGSYSFKVADPTRVKSAAPVTYDDEGNVIPLSKRFDATNKDIRYSIGGIFTGSGADYANRSRQGRVDDGPSLKHIGSGEGSQVYGWGLYGSKVRGVAEGYADNYDSDEIEYLGEQPPPKIASWAEKNLKAHHGDIDATVQELSSALFPPFKEAAKWLKDNKGSIRYTRKDTPHLYEQTFFTNRAPGDESHLLKWYEPTDIKVQNRLIEEAKRDGVIEEDEDGFIVAKNSQLLLEKNTTLRRPLEGRELYSFFQRVFGSSQSASEWLFAHEIDGVKYPVDSFGGKSIKDGDKAGWNYVAFSDKNIRVDHKWVNGEQRYFKNDKGKVVATYNRKTGEITLYPGAKAKDVVHEFSHGLWQFAEQEAAAGRSTLMTKFRTIADSAPQAVKDAVKANYGTDDPNVYLEECFTHEMARQSEGDSAFARAIETPEGRPWYRRAWGVIKSTWNRFAAFKKLANVDVSKMDRMDAAQSAKFILRQLAKGMHFGTVQHAGSGGTRKSILGKKPYQADKTPDLFEEFGIAQDAEDVAITSDEMAEAFLEAFGMDGGEPEPDDPNFWEKHDKKHHHGHFDPETQRCSLREEVEQAEKATDKDDDIGSEQPNVAGLESPSQRGAEQNGNLKWVEELIQKAPSGRRGYTPRERRKALESWASTKRAFIPLDRHSLLTEVFGNDPRWLKSINALKSVDFLPRFHTGSNRRRWKRTEGFDGFSYLGIDGNACHLHTRNGYTSGGFGRVGVESGILLVNTLRHNGIQAEYSDLGNHHGPLVRIDEAGRMRSIEKDCYPAVSAPRYTETEVASLAKGSQSFSTPDEAKDFLHSVFRSRPTQEVKNVVLDNLVPFDKDTEDAIFLTYAPIVREQICRYPALQGILTETAFIPGVDSSETSSASASWYKENPQGPVKTMLHCRMDMPNKGKSEDGIPLNVEDLVQIPKNTSSDEFHEAYEKNQQEKRRALLMHEIGHIIYHQNNLEGEWQALVDRAAKEERDGDRKWYKNISHYAEKNLDEAHSEALALYTLPNYEKGTLPECVEDYFSKILGEGGTSAEKTVSAQPSEEKQSGKQKLVDKDGNEIPDLFALFGIE